jgi:glycosyltransferase involved in cell wall biosynthesis
LILVAEALRRRFSFGTVPGKLVTIHNGVDLDRFKPEGSTSEVVDTGAGRSELTIATVGRIEAQKGLYNLLQACRVLKRSGHAIKLRVAGEVTDPFYFQRCMDFCRKEGLAGQIEFLGQVQKMEESADIFVLPSEGAEAFPRSVLEAMACGKPIIVTDAGGSREAVESGKTGYVVPVRAPAALADRLRELIENEGLRARMGRTGRQRVEAHFGAAENAERIMGVYEEVLR